MIWNDVMLAQWASIGGISPFAPELVNPASLDLRWSGRYRFREGGKWSDVQLTSVLWMQPGELYLLDTLEYITMPPDAAGDIKLKSRVGRRGIEHLHAGFVEPAFAGTLTLEMTNVLKSLVPLQNGDRLVQLVLMSMAQVPQKPYSEVGHFMGQTEPTTAEERV